jgi:phage replication initiation protein
VETLLDWLSYTYPVARSVESVLEELEGNFVPLVRGMYGYNTAYIRGGVMVLCDGKPDMGVHVQISGQGCRELELLGVEWVGFLRVLLKAGCKPRRVDLAIDERTGLLDLEVVRQAATGGNVVTKLKKGHDGVQFAIHGGQTTGHTVVFGSRGGESFVRVYDKGLEQGTPGHWMRAELELRNDRAVAVAREIVRSGSLEATAAAVLLATLDFKEPGTDSNARRWRTAEWWSGLLEAAKVKVRLRVPRKEETLAAKEEWLRKCVARTLGLVLMAHRGDPRFLEKLAAEGACRLKPYELALLRRWLEAEDQVSAELEEEVNDGEERNEEGEIPL